MQCFDSAGIINTISRSPIREYPVIRRGEAEKYYSQKMENIMKFEDWKPRKHGCDWAIEIAEDPAAWLKKTGLDGKHDFIAQFAERALTDPKAQAANEALADGERALRKLEAAYAKGESEAVLRALYDEVVRCDEIHEELSADCVAPDA